MVTKEREREKRLRSRRKGEGTIWLWECCGTGCDQREACMHMGEWSWTTSYKVL